MANYLVEAYDSGYRYRLVSGEISDARKTAIGFAKSTRGATIYRIVAPYPGSVKSSSITPIEDVVNMDGEYIVSIRPSGRKDSLTTYELSPNGGLRRRLF